MALPDLTPAQRQYWPVIQGAAADKLTTTDLWNRIRQYEADRGINRPGGLFAAVSAMRGLGTAQRLAQNALMAATDQQVISDQMIAQDIHSRPLSEQALSPSYKITFEAVVSDETGTRNTWLTYVSDGYLPTTKGDLMSLIDSEAPALAIGSDVEYQGFTGAVKVTAV